MNLPRVYRCSQSWTPRPSPFPHHLSGSSQCTSHKHPVSCIKPGLVIHFLYDIIHVSMYCPFLCLQFSSVQSISHVRLFATPWIAALQASLSIISSRSSPKLMCIESVMPSTYLIRRHPLLLLPSIPPSIRVFSNESTLHMRWPKSPRADLL